MYDLFRPASAGLAALCLGGPVAAATLSATPTTLVAVFNAAAAGDTIRLAAGTYGRTALRDRRFATPLTINAADARFTSTLSFSNVEGVVLRGGRYQVPAIQYARGITVSGGADISIEAPIVTGYATTQGVSVSGARAITVVDGRFTGLKLGIGLTQVTGAELLRNEFSRMTSDGINIAGSHQVLARYNRCSDTRIEALAHPDCVQMWSITGWPPQSDIEVSDNVISGPTQGISSFNGSAGGIDRLTVQRNRIDTSYPNGIACQECRDAVITDNVLTTQLGAQWQTRINMSGGARNTVANNSIGPRP